MKKQCNSDTKILFFFRSIVFLVREGMILKRRKVSRYIPFQFKQGKGENNAKKPVEKKLYMLLADKLVNVKHFLDTIFLWDYGV